MTDQVEDQDVELDEEIEEAHDPKNAEAQSIASVDKAEKAGKKAPARKGDKSNSEPSHLKGAGTKAESVDFDGDFSEDLTLWLNLRQLSLMSSKPKQRLFLKRRLRLNFLKKLIV